MKNAALVLTSSTITTIFVLIGIFAANPQMHVDLMMGFWVDWWEFNVLGWIIVGIICATAVLTFVFATGKRLRISYILAATTGVFLGILMDMIIYTDAVIYWMP